MRDPLVMPLDKMLCGPALTRDRTGGSERLEEPLLATSNLSV